MDDPHEMKRLRMSLKNYFCYQFGMPIHVFKKQEGALICILFDKVSLRKLESFFKEENGIQVDDTMIRKLDKVFTSKPLIWKDLASKKFIKGLWVGIWVSKLPPFTCSPQFLKALKKIPKEIQLD